MTLFCGNFIFMTLIWDHLFLVSLILDYYSTKRDWTRDKSMQKLILEISKNQLVSGQPLALV